MTEPAATSGSPAAPPAHLVDAVLAQARRTPDAVALRWWGRAPLGARRRPEETTYAELARRVEATAGRLAAAGLRPGGRVLFSVRPRTQGVVLALAVVRARGAVVFVDPGSTPELFAARVAAAGPVMAATESLLYAVSGGPAARWARARGLLLPRYADLPVRHVSTGPWLPGVPRGALRASVLARPDTGAPDVGGGPGTADDEALVVFTSGTTAAPRAVVHTAGSLSAATAMLAGVHAIGPGDVVHTDQMLLGLPALLAGGTWSIPAGAPREDVRAFARGVSGAAATYLVPADVTALLDAVERGEGPAVAPATVLVGGAPVTRTLLERATSLLPGTRWVGVYGMTEALPVAVVEAREKLAWTGDGDLVGTPVPGVAVRLDADELVVAGPCVMAGYLGAGGRVEPVAEHRTGDLARWDGGDAGAGDGGGRLVLLGRTRDMIIRGTVNIYPGLYEPRLSRLPGVAAAVLLGVPQPDGDERVVLAVVPSGGAGPAAPDEATPSGAPGGPGRGDGVPGDVRPRGVPGTEGPVVVRRATALSRDVAARLPDVLDHGALPDDVVEVDRVPLAGRSRKPDRASLVRALAALDVPPARAASGV